MKIIFIVTQLTNGGTEREAAVFANELVKMGQEVHIISTHDVKDDYTVDKRVHRHLFQETRVQIPKLKGALNTAHMIALLKKIKGDVAVLFYVPFHLAVLLSGTKLVHTVRCNPEKELRNRKAKFRWNLACRFANGIWIQTVDQRYFLPKSLQDKIFEVHNILDSRFLQIHRVSRGQVARFISVGRLHPQKNQKLLIEAFEKMIRKTGNQSVTLTIYGRSRKNYRQTEEELREMISRLQLEGRVVLAGRVQDIEKKYEEADAFVFSSNYEGCPNVLMEAMAAGLPCISTDCPTGPSLLIENGKNGLLVPVGDVEMMARDMEYLIDHPWEAEQLGRAAKQRMLEWGTSQEHAEQLLENLRKINSYT